MPDRFERVIRIVEKRFFELNPASGVHGFLIGQINKDEQRCPGDVVFVSTGGTFRPNPHHGPGFDEGSDSTTTGMLWVDSKRFELVTWGNDAKEAEDLRDAIFRAIDQTVGNRNFRPIDYADVTEEAEFAGHNWRGRSLVTTCEIDIVIPKETTAFRLTDPETTSGDYENV